MSEKIITLPEEYSQEVEAFAACDGKQKTKLK